jgi:hypothetical protein
MIVRPRIDGGQTTITVHRLVAAAFLGPRPDGMMICHWNGDPADNRVENLRYATRVDNALDSLRHGTHFPGSLTMCVKGKHPLDGPNLYISPKSGKRMCRACAETRRQRRREAA